MDIINKKKSINEKNNNKNNNNSRRGDIDLLEFVRICVLVSCTTNKRLNK